MYKLHFKFLKQYLTLNRSELFFADKAILIEGDTERVLLPAMMKKIDQESQDNSVTPLLSQNISIVEVGAHSQTFEKFIDFIGVKTLIITDIDSYYEQIVYEEGGLTPKTHKNGKNKTEVVTCKPDDVKAQKTSNNSLVFFHNRNDINYFLALSTEEKALAKQDGIWKPDTNGTLFMAFQTKEDDYYGRSFEDAFFSINKSLLGNDANSYPSLTKKWFDKYINNKIDAFYFCKEAVGSKPSLATK